MKKEAYGIPSPILAVEMAPIVGVTVAHAVEINSQGRSDQQLAKTIIWFTPPYMYTCISGLSLESK